MKPLFEKLLKDLKDLRVQVIQERSHFYVRSVIDRVITTLENQQTSIKKFEEKIKKDIKELKYFKSEYSKGKEKGINKTLQHFKEIFGEGKKLEK